MRSLEVIENELSAAREALSKVKGTPAEVYSRIVGYYRSVRNWNKGKREEYGERSLFKPESCIPRSVPAETGRTETKQVPSGQAAGARLLLFVRPACPACPGAKTAAGKLGLPVDTVNADTDEGYAEAVKRGVMSTPTAILLSHKGEELGRAGDAGTIGALLSGAERAAV